MKLALKPWLRDAPELLCGVATAASILPSHRTAFQPVPPFRNIKPDALSCLFSPDSSTPNPETILQPPHVVGDAYWEIEIVREAQRAQPDPGRGSAGCS